MRIKENKGITLIALVITIIVLLILAGVTLNIVLGDDGIITRAQASNEAQKNAEEKDMMAIAKAEAATLKYGNQEAMKEEEVSSKFTFTQENPYNNNVAKVTEDGVPIPLGFAHVQGTTKDEGLIVVDGYGNEFVWVPVDTFADFAVLQADGENYRGVLYAKKIDGSEGIKIDINTNSEETIYNANNGLREPAILTGSTGTTFDGKDANENAILESKYTELGLLSQFQDEYNAMAKSVKTYGGFYVGRYETSWTGSRVASVQGATPTKEEGKNEIFTAETDLGTEWTTEKTGEYVNKATWYGLYKYQKELYNKDADSVVSGMIYGAQWDAIMNWMKNIDNPNVEGAKFIKDSTGMGNYKKTDGTDKAISTGSNDNYKVNNIYDLAGNCYEWTQEACDSGKRVWRGGASNSPSGYNEPASFRLIKFDPTYIGSNCSSRLQLYIK